MKYSRKNRAIVSGIMVGLASIYAVASYFDVQWAELNSFMLSTLLFFAGIVLLAVVAVVLLKLCGNLFRRLRPDAADTSAQKDKDLE